MRPNLQARPTPTPQRPAPPPRHPPEIKAQPSDRHVFRPTREALRQELDSLIVLTKFTLDWTWTPWRGVNMFVYDTRMYVLVLEREIIR
eukprot:1079352-Prorocentrum_minimum.AAC.3